MTTQEIITLRQSQTQAFQYKLVKGSIYRKSLSDKKFSYFQSEEVFVESFLERQRQLNATINSVKMNDYLISLGFEKTAHSTTSSYFQTKNGLVRVSNHHWTSEKHFTPNLNLCSYENNGYEEMINQFNIFINASN